MDHGGAKGEGMMRPLMAVVVSAVLLMVSAMYGCGGESEPAESGVPEWLPQTPGELVDNQTFQATTIEMAIAAGADDDTTRAYQGLECIKGSHEIYYCATRRALSTYTGRTDPLSSTPGAFTFIATINVRSGEVHVARHGYGLIETVFEDCENDVQVCRDELEEYGVKSFDELGYPNRAREINSPENLEPADETCDDAKFDEFVDITEIEVGGVGCEEALAVIDEFLASGLQRMNAEGGWRCENYGGSGPPTCLSVDDRTIHFRTEGYRP